MNAILIIILMTLIPFLELRASIPYGIFEGSLDWKLVFIVCVITNILLGPVIYFLLDKFVHLFLEVKWIDRIYKRIVNRTQKRIQKYVDRWGTLGVAVFIGIPLPGSGSYSGALGSYLIGLGYRKFIIANVIGVLIAGIIITAIALSGSSAFQFLIK